MRVKFRHFFVDFYALTAVAQIGMYGKGKVYGRGAYWQVNNIAFGRKAENSMLKQIELKGLHEFPGVFMQPFLKFAQLADPHKFFTRLETFFGFARFVVGPMGGNAVFGVFMHLGRSNLYFQNVPAGAENSGVQTLITVRFREGNVIFYFARHWPELFMEKSHDGVAVAGAFGNDSNRYQVVNIA